MAYAFHATPVNAPSTPTPPPPPSFDPHLLEGHLRAVGMVELHRATVNAFVAERDAAKTLGAFVGAALTLVTVVTLHLSSLAFFSLCFPFVASGMALGHRYCPDRFTTPRMRAWRVRHGCQPHDRPVLYDHRATSLALARLSALMPLDETKREAFAYEETTSFLLGWEYTHEEEKKTI